MSEVYINIPSAEGGGGGGTVDSVNGQTGTVVITTTDLGLGNVDNTSDANKPISTATQTALNAKMNNPAFTVTQTVYVAVGGNDTTGDGSIGNPWQTVSKALSEITTAQSDNRYMIKLMGGKIVDTTTPLLKPWIYIVGDNEDGTYWKVTAAGNNIGLDPSFATVGGARFGISNVYIGAGTNLDVDLNAIGPGIGTPSAEMDLEDITVTGNLTFNGRAPDIDYMQLKGVYVIGTFNADAAQIDALVCTFAGTTNLTSNIAAANSQFTASLFQGPLTISGTNTNIELITASPITSTLVVSGASTVLSADSVSLPPKTSQTLSSGGSIILLGDSFNLKYFPSISSNWASTAPSDVSDAINRISTLLKTLNSGNPIP